MPLPRRGGPPLSPFLSRRQLPRMRSSSVWKPDLRSDSSGYGTTGLRPMKPAASATLPCSVWPRSAASFRSASPHESGACAHTAKYALRIAGQSAASSRRLVALKMSRLQPHGPSQSGNAIPPSRSASVMCSSHHGITPKKSLAYAKSSSGSPSLAVYALALITFWRASRASTSRSQSCTLAPVISAKTIERAT
eukprot:7378420-Prymnesium_polylepis.2